MDIRRVALATMGAALIAVVPLPAATAATPFGAVGPQSATYGVVTDDPVPSDPATEAPPAQDPPATDPTSDPAGATAGNPAAAPMAATAPIVVDAPAPTYADNCGVLTDLVTIPQVEGVDYTIKSGSVRLLPGAIPAVLLSEGVGPTNQPWLGTNEGALWVIGTRWQVRDLGFTGLTIRIDVAPRAGYQLTDGAPTSFTFTVKPDRCNAKPWQPLTVGQTACDTVTVTNPAGNPATDNALYVEDVVADTTLKPYNTTIIDSGKAATITFAGAKKYVWIVSRISGQLVDSRDLTFTPLTELGPVSPQIDLAALEGYVDVMAQQGWQGFVVRASITPCPALPDTGRPDPRPAAFLGVGLIALGVMLTRARARARAHRS